MTIDDQLASAAADLAVARAGLVRAKDAAKAAAVAAHKAGHSEVAIAKALGVDRANTLRRWLGKA